MGVAVRVGLEAIIHDIMELSEVKSDILILQVDLINAFNCAVRDAAFKEELAHFPDILKWVLTCYGC